MSQTLFGRQNVSNTTVSLLEVYLTLLFTPEVPDALFLPPSNMSDWHELRGLVVPEICSRSGTYYIPHSQKTPCLIN